ncbi:hypothetical protein Xhom_04255 [Xenorhabdus hominickii]|uniref:Uncharacterized protein n=1 Tax=Xenorhabdus hominickii TaxID=351679 RepID=A0A2G0Q052_XENHO|nr:hypothetical protein Xhom_04255 [Xenorhabdus hominickii]
MFCTDCAVHSSAVYIDAIPTNDKNLQTDQGPPILGRNNLDRNCLILCRFTIVW